MGGDVVAVVVTGGDPGHRPRHRRGRREAGAEGSWLSGRDATKGAAAAAEVERAGRARFFVAADLERCGLRPARIFDAALERFGRVDALVNAAALTDRGSLAEANMALWEPALRRQCAGAVLSDAAAGEPSA